MADRPPDIEHTYGKHRCGLCHGYGAANSTTHEPVACMACGKASEGMVLIALDPPADEPQQRGLRLVTDQDNA